MTPEELVKKLKEQGKEAARFINEDAPVIAGKTAADMFKENFQNESFFGEPWQEVQRRMDYYAIRGKRRKNYTKGAARTRKILTGASGDLGRSITYDVKGKGLVRIIAAPRTFTGGNYYALYHNEGTETIPQRQFMGDHPKVTDKIIDEVQRKLNQILGV